MGGHYTLVSQVNIGVLNHYVKLGKLLFHRFFFYALFSTIFYVAFLALFLTSFSRENPFIISFGEIVSAIFWCETYRVWAQRPF